MSTAISSPLAIAGISLADHATAIMESLMRLRTATASVTELLDLTGFGGMRGDTADDLRQAIAIHEHLVREFNVKVRTSAGITTFCTCAANAACAAEAELERQGDTPCGITVTPSTPAEPDRPALAAAHRFFGVTASLDAALEDPRLGRALRSYARKHPVRRMPATDFKSLAANDRD